MMRLFTFWACLAVVGIWGGLSFSTSAQAGEETPSPAMWYLGDEDTHVYLLGTVHFMPPGLAWQTPKITATFEKADTVYFEADPAMLMDQASMGVLIKKWALLPADKKLGHFFTDEELVTLKTGLVKAGIPFAHVERFRPWFVSMLLSAAQVVQAGGDSQAGIDQVLYAQARAAAKNVRSFETVEQQFGIFGEMSDTRHATILLDMLKQYEENVDLFPKMVTAWRKGDTANLERMLSEIDVKDADILERLLYERNGDWANKIETVLKTETGTYFVAVGAAHLVGERSVQDFLATKGYKVSRQ